MASGSSALASSTRGVEMCTVDQAVQLVVGWLSSDPLELQNGDEEDAVLREAEAMRIVYAARKRQRVSQSDQPREFDPMYPLSFVSGSPSRGRVLIQRIHRRPRSLLALEIVMDQWSPAEWLANVRVSQHLFLYIVAELEPFLPRRDLHTGGKPQRPLWAQVGATLGWLGGGRPQDLQEIWGLRHTSFTRARDAVIPAMLKCFGDRCMPWPSVSDLEAESEKFAQWCKFPGAVGAVDGLVVPGSLLGDDLRPLMYNTRKDTYGYNLQAVVNSNCEFTYVDVSQFALVHDGRAFKDSKLYGTLASGWLCSGGADAGTYFLLADNAYGLRSFCVHPWKGEGPALAAGTMGDSFNFYLAAARCTVERAFGQLLLAFPILQHGVQARSMEAAAATIRCCVLLHNLRKAWKEGEAFATPQTNDGTRRMLATEEDAQAYARQMGDDQVGDRYLGERTVAQAEDVMIATNKQIELAHWLHSHGYCRPSAVQDDRTPCPNEPDEFAEGLIYTHLHYASKA